MEWYWYVIIVVGILIIGVLKLVIWNRIQKNRDAKKSKTKHLNED